jgi:hypothetical protein
MNKVDRAESTNQHIDYNFK